jgi:S-formylglutathione hydrolase FrmB
MRYLCDELVPFVDEHYPTAAHRDNRGLTGKSSGGYGAMVVPMLRPDVFGGLASHAGDALFEACYLPSFPKVVRRLRDDFEGSYEVFFDRLAEADNVDFGRFGEPLETYGYAACYSPDPANPGKALLPFDVDTGRLLDDVWAQWLAWDPVRMAPGRAEALRSMRRILLDAGRSDEYHLDLGAIAFAREVERAGATCTLELFDGTHGGLTYRYPGAIRELARALAP